MLHIGLLILRVSVGVLMLVAHGWPKLGKLLSGDPIQFPDPIGLGTEISFYLVVFAEVVCSILLISGALTRLSLIPLITTMLVAVFVVKSGKPLDVIELPLLFLVVYVGLFFTGPGNIAAKIPSSTNNKWMKFILE